MTQLNLYFKYQIMFRRLNIPKVPDARNTINYKNINRRPNKFLKKRLFVGKLTHVTIKQFQSTKQEKSYKQFYGSQLSETI